MAVRYWVYDPDAERIGGHFETPRGAAQAARLLTEETGRSYRWGTATAPTCDHDGALLERVGGDDPALPPFMDRLECPECGEWYIRDNEDGTLTVDA